MAAHIFVDDLARLGRLTLAALPAAMLLAIGSALLLASAVAVAIQLPAPDAVVAPLLLVLVAWLHGAFIATIAWKQAHPGAHLLRGMLSPGLKAGALLAVPILGFGLLDLWSGSYSCADGAAYDRSQVPDLPWLWIGWLALTISAAPARALGLTIGERPPLLPLARRTVMTVLSAPFVLLTGTVFEWRTVDCTPPFDGWGLFEGGLVLLPLAGLFWFVMSYAMASVAAASVDQVSLERR